MKSYILHAFDTSFNSIKVQLRPGYYQGTDATLCTFNSIKVQLRLVLALVMA